MSTVFFTADPHFGHTNIIRYENRPFASAEEMDQELIRRWNETVSPEDTVYLLGDFSFYGKEKSTEILSALQGHIRLVMGNHDTRSTQWYRDCGFEEVYDCPILFESFWLLSQQQYALWQSLRTCPRQSRLCRRQFPVLLRLCGTHRLPSHLL